MTKALATRRGDGYVERVYRLGPTDLGAARQTPVRVVFANSSSPDAVADWLAAYGPADVKFGLDVEWRPNQQRGEENPVALLQLAGRHGCLIIQLLRLEWIPKALSDFFSNSNIILAGVGIAQDCAKLTQDYGFNIQAHAVDLRKYAAARFDDKSLRGAGIKKLCSLFWSDPLAKAKRVTLSAWDAEYLTEDQEIYAATDAFMCYQTLRQLLEGMPMTGREKKYGSEIRAMPDSIPHDDIPSGFDVVLPGYLEDNFRDPPRKLLEILDARTWEAIGLLEFYLYHGDPLFKQQSLRHLVIPCNAFPTRSSIGAEYGKETNGLLRYANEVRKSDPRRENAPRVTVKVGNPAI